MDTSLLSGWFSWLIAGLGLLGAAFLLARRERWWWLYLVPSVLVVCGIAAWLLGTIGGQRLFAAPLKTSDIVFIGVSLSAIALAVGNFFRTPWWRKVLAVIAAILVVAAAGNQINKSYQEYPTVQDLFGPTADSGQATQLSRDPAVPDTPTGTPLTATWIPRGAGIPADGKGKLQAFEIPDTTSGFTARPGWVYLPPAYFADNKEPLPVLVLMHGQPGGPDDWITGNRLQGVMDDFAAQHNGIAPVVVVPDVLGSSLANPLCADSTLGNADSYLAKDLPNAITKQLNVSTDHRQWAVGGFSYGGTCSLQLATNHPDIYPTFIDIEGQAEPTLDEGTNGRTTTVDTAFGGDESKFTAINPADLLRQEKFPDSAGWFIWGETDPDAAAALQSLAQLATDAGMTIKTWQAPATGHDWGTALLGLSQVMPWLATRTGLTP